MKFYFYIFILSFLYSCGTLRPIDHFIAVDAKKNGGVVSVQGSEYKVPNLIKVNPQRKLSIESKDYYPLTLRCNVNYENSIFPGAIFAPFFPVGTSISATSIATDYITGQIFDCNNMIKLKSKNGLKDRPTKEKALVIPYLTSSYSLNRIIENDIKIRLEKKNINYHKDSIIDRMQYSGLSSSRVFSGELSELRKIWPIAKEVGATSVIFYTSKDRESFKAIEMNIYNGEKIIRDDLSFYKKYDRKLSVSSFIMDYVSIIPTSLSLRSSTKPTLRVVDEKGSREVVSDRHPHELPEALRLISLQYIDHPNLYGPWDYNFSLSPSIGFNSFSVPATDGSINWADMYIVGDGALTLYSPFGQFSFSLGIGTMYTSYGLENKKNVTNFDTVTKVSVGYYGFFSDRFYFTWNVSSFSLADKKISEVNTQLEGWSEGSIGIGYYYPELRDLVRSFFTD